MSVSLVKMADEAFATGVMPPGYKAIAGYLKSSADFHTWTRADWAKFGKVKKLPIYVAPAVLGNDVNPKGDAFSVLNMLFDLKVPKGSPVALDMETVANPVYVDRFCRVVNWGGYLVWVYGSASTVFGNPAPVWGGYWVADYTGVPFMYNHAKVRATQYQAGATYDSSEVSAWQYLYRLKSW